MKMSSKRKITVMIQARTGSTRLPRKVLAKIENRLMIWHVINRVKKIKNIQQIILITTKRKEDRILLRIAKENKIIGFTGDTFDVLNRHYKCALQYNADPIVRITSDCPLIDPLVVEKILRFYLKQDYDYASNTIVRTFPHGLDTEIFSFDALEMAAHNAKMKSEREHVTPYIKSNTDQFKIFNYKNNKDLSKFRWTVDEKQDLKFVRRIYFEMKPKKIFFMQDVLKIISKNPKILEINAGIMN